VAGKLDRDVRRVEGYHFRSESAKRPFSVKGPPNRQERRAHLQRPPPYEAPPSRTQRVRKWLWRSWRAPDFIKVFVCGIGALGLMKIFKLIAPSSPTAWFITVLILGIPALILIATAVFLALRMRFRMFGVH
jgi:hypothetical protein